MDGAFSCDGLQKRSEVTLQWLSSEPEIAGDVIFLGENRANTYPQG